MNNGIYKATIGRTATHHGAKIGKQMGVNTWAAFAERTKWRVLMETLR